MVDFGDIAYNRFVCPNDRQLSLRAKLQSGWSVKSATTGPRKPHVDAINVEEQDAIVAVIKRNEELESVEQERVGKLMDRLEKLRRNATGRSTKQCLLCGDHFGFLGAQKLICTDCRLSVCHKCSIDGSISCLCLICSETREVWKKSGAWFYKSFPKYILPTQASTTNTTTRKINLPNEDNDNSSDDDIKPKWTATTDHNSSHMDSVHNQGTNPNPHVSSPDSPSCDQDTSRRDSLISDMLYWSESERLSPGGASSCLVDPSATLGVIELAIAYDAAASTLHCTIYRCRHLPPMDINGLSDAYCRVNVLPPSGVNRATTRLRTRTVHKTRHPEFNESLTFYDVSGADVVRKALHVTVADEDRYGDDCMGGVQVPLVQCRLQKTVYLTLPLERLPSSGSHDEWFDEVGDGGGGHRGHILLALTYSTKRRALLVTVVRCAHLLPMDNNGYSDPFVKLALRRAPSDGAVRKHRTSTKRKCLSPVFDEEFAFEGRPTELAAQTLHVAVWDKDFGKPDDYLGGVLIGGAGCKGRRLKHWLDMIRYPDHRHELWHHLIDDQSDQV